MICGYDDIVVVQCVTTRNAAWLFPVSCNPWKSVSNPSRIATYQRYSLHMPNMAEVYFGKVVLQWRLLERKGCEECYYGRYIIS